jgi:hypothetical protein
VIGATVMPAELFRDQIEAERDFGDGR